MSQPLTKSPDELIAQLAELDEQQESGTKLVPTGLTIENLKAELETFLSDLRQPAPRDEYADESACEQVIQRVQTIGREPSDPGDKSVATPTGQAESSTASAPTLASLGHYELLSKIGEGGMGAVYKARNKKLDKIVALKVLPKDKMQDKSSVARFEREMRAVGKLDHPHIVRAMDAGEENGTHFLVMEYVQGIDLSQLVKQLGPLPVAEACELIRQAAVGLEEAHDHGMVHRDIKPSNLMLCVHGKRQPPMVKILDMGLALLSEAHSPDVQGLTSTGQMMGTVDYMAPEQGDDSKSVDIRADLYSLGASLYKLLTGETVYHGGQYQTLMQKMMGLASKPAPPIRECRADIPPELAAIVHRLLEKDLSQRFATPDEVARALAPFAAGANLASLLTKVGYEGLEAPVADEAKSRTTPSASAPDVDTGTMPRHSLPSTVDHVTPADADAPLSREASAPGRVSGTALAAGSSPGKSTPRGTTTPAAIAIPLNTKPVASPIPLNATPVAIAIPLNTKPVASAIPLTATAVLPVRRRSIPKPRVALALGGVLLMLLAAVVYRIQTDQGTLVVTIEDPAVQAILEQDGLVIRDKHSDRTWTITATETKPLPSGKYQVEGKPNLQLLVTDDSGAEVTTNEFTLKRKGEVRVRVTLEQDARIAGKASTKSITSDTDRRAAEYVLSIGGNIKIKENGQERDIKTEGDLPRGAFELTDAYLANNPKVSNAALVHFQGCKNLTELDLHSRHVRESELAYFKDCKKLTVLHLANNDVSDVGLAHFVDCKNTSLASIWAILNLVIRDWPTSRIARTSRNLIWAIRK